MGKVLSKPRVLSEGDYEAGRSLADRLSREKDTRNREMIQTKALKGTCYRCGGTGYIDEYSYNLEGICFACNGDGHIKQR